MTQKQLPPFSRANWELAGIVGTGGNRDNGVIAIPLALFSPSTLFPPSLFVEVKATDEVHPINKAQLLSYMKLLDIPLSSDHQLQ
jgi:hypothetical protein